MPLFFFWTYLSFLFVVAFRTHLYRDFVTFSQANTANHQLLIAKTKKH